ncbi:MAG: DUF2809 domain-containing protein [Myxacorys californica WJT36-NPBG1]|jgi:hypothetical protein|nr:DUF2809 domain-containing protein [Myxacorys californica WJT36-NPBG1]
MPYRVALLVSILFIIPVGYGVRFSQGWLPNSLHDALGSLAYEVFWILLVQLLYPKIPPLRIAIAVSLATCAIEVLQLWQPSWLQALRATLPGRLVLGNTFSWSDFPPYFIGSVMGWLWLEGLRRWQRMA